MKTRISRNKILKKGMLVRWSHPGDSIRYGLGIVLDEWEYKYTRSSGSPKDRYKSVDYYFKIFWTRTMTADKWHNDRSIELKELDVIYDPTA